MKLNINFRKNFKVEIKGICIGKYFEVNSHLYALLMMSFWFLVVNPAGVI